MSEKQIKETLVEFLNDLEPIMKKHNVYLIAESQSDEFARVGFQVLAHGVNEHVNQMTDRCHFGHFDIKDHIYSMNKETTNDT